MKVNLLPYQMVQKAGRNWRGLFALGGVILLASATLIFYVALQAQITRYEQDIAAMETEYQQYTAALERKKLLDEMQAAFSEKSGFITQLSGSGVKWNTIMDELRSIIPKTVVLYSVSSTEGTTIDITGQADTLQALAQFMINIQKANRVTKPDVRDVNWDQAAATFLFTMTCETKEVPAGGQP